MKDEPNLWNKMFQEICKFENMTGFNVNSICNIKNKKQQNFSKEIECFLRQTVEMYALGLYMINYE